MLKGDRKKPNLRVTITHQILREEESAKAKQKTFKGHQNINSCHQFPIGDSGEKKYRPMNYIFFRDFTCMLPNFTLGNNFMANFSVHQRDTAN